MIKTRRMEGWTFSRHSSRVLLFAFGKEQLVILLFKFGLVLSFFSVKNHFSSEVYLSLKHISTKYLDHLVSKI